MKSLWVHESRCQLSARLVPALWDIAASSPQPLVNVPSMETSAAKSSIPALLITHEEDKHSYARKLEPHEGVEALGIEE